MSEAQYYGPGKLPEGIVRVNEESGKEFIDEFIDVVARGLCGTTSTNPEPSLGYIVEDTVSKEQVELNKTQHTCPLKEPPSEERQAIFKFIASFGFYATARHGGCYAMVVDSRIVCAAVTFTPNDDDLYKIGFPEMISIGMKAGGQPPAPVTSGNTGKKFERIDEVMHACHKIHASGRHIYLWMFSTEPTVQGKGYGSRMLKFLAGAADFQKVPIYLESSGKKNEAFYSNREYTVASRLKFEVPALSPDDKSFVECFEPDGQEGLTAMVRKPA